MEVIDCLHTETLSIQLGKGGRTGTESLRGVLHGGLFTKNNVTGLAVSLNVEMSSEATDCGFDLVEEFLGNGVEARRPQRQTDKTPQHCFRRETDYQAYFSLCERVGDVQGVVTLFCGGVAQTCHDDRVVELKEQLVVEEVDGEGQEGKVKEEGRGRIKESAPWMV